MPTHTCPSLSSDTWVRAGRGRSFQFYACDEEVLQLLQSSLPQGLGPYSLIGTYVEAIGRTPIHRFVTAAVGEFPTLRAKGIWQFFLRSWQATPTLDLPADATLAACLSLYGMVSIQHGCTLKGQWQWSSIGLVNRIRNTFTEELVAHESYEQLFRTLKPRIRKILQYATEHMMPDGSVQESTSLRMSRQFAERCNSGEILAKDRVGRTLVKTV